MCVCAVPERETSSGGGTCPVAQLLALAALSGSSPGPAPLLITLANARPDDEKPPTRVSILRIGIYNNIRARAASSTPFCIARASSSSAELLFLRELSFSPRSALVWRSFFLSCSFSPAVGPVVLQGSMRTGPPAAVIHFYVAHCSDFTRQKFGNCTLNREPAGQQPAGPGI